jgi:hypothetical protein
VFSQVHTYNSPMRGLNKKLLSQTEQDPDDGNCLLTAVLAEATT